MGTRSPLCANLHPRGVTECHHITGRLIRRTRACSLKPDTAQAVAHVTLAFFLPLPPRCSGTAVHEADHRRGGAGQEQSRTAEREATGGVRARAVGKPARAARGGGRSVVPPRVRGREPARRSGRREVARRRSKARGGRPAEALPAAGSSCAGGGSPRRLASARRSYFRWVGHAVVVPHPSGRSRWWNDPRNVARARRFFRSSISGKSM